VGGAIAESASMACPKKPLGRWLQVPPLTANRATSRCASDITDSDTDMWSVASDDAGAFRPRMDTAMVWHLLRKVHARVENKCSFMQHWQQQHLSEAQLQQLHVQQLHMQTASPNKLGNAQRKMEEAVARLREAQMEVEEANDAERLARLTEHSPELLTCCSQRIQELENENRALRCSLLKNNDIEATDCLPLPRFRAGHFQINGSDDEGEATGDKHHSLAGLFDISWDQVGSKHGSCVNSMALTRQPSPDSCNDVGSDVETTTEATTAAQPPTSPQLTGSSFNTAAHFIAFERLMHKLSEEDAKLVWLQFARYESEIGYLRSVISSYEDICLRGDAGEWHPERPPSTTGRNRLLSGSSSSSVSVRRPRSAHRFKEAKPRGETWSRAASCRSRSFSSPGGNPDEAAADSLSIESFLEGLPPLRSECTARPACEASDGQCEGGILVVPMKGLSSVSPLQPAPAA